MMIVRPDLLDEKAPAGVEVVQLTREDRPTSHIYMEAQIFTPDSRRFVLHRSATPHGPDKHDPEHRYLVCDVDDGSLRPITDELGAIAPSVSPDGATLYYVIDALDESGGRIELKRVGLDGSDRRTLAVIDGEIAGTGLRPALKVYPLSTIRSDGRRLAIQTGLRRKGDAEPTWGLFIFDLATGAYELVHEGPSWFNMHPQYCRSMEAGAMRDIMIQHNHTDWHDKPFDALRPDIHVIRDDGANLRDFPCGRDGDEHCHGHQCWRGRTSWAVIGTQRRKTNTRFLVECRPAPPSGHLGNRTPGSRRNELSRPEGFPRTAHFATDISGCRLVTDADPYDVGGRIILMDLGEPGVDAASNLAPLAWTRTANVHTRSDAHPHPFLSPDGTMAFFNSTESGILQAYMIRGL